MKYLYYRLKTMREGITGGNMRNASWLRREMKQILDIAWRDDIKDSYRDYLIINVKLNSLNDFSDMKKRIEIDQDVCKILNRLLEEMEGKDRMKQ